MEEYEDEIALLAWFNLLDGSQVESLSELSDGRLLLSVMHDVAPNDFVDPGGVHVGMLLEGLVKHLQDSSGCGKYQAQELLRRSRTGPPDGAQLASLVMWATIQPDVADRYKEVFQQMRPESLMALKQVIEYFNQEGDVEGFARGGHLEVGLDYETRYRDLKDLYTIERGQWDEDRAQLKRELEDESNQRRSAENAVQVARAELRHMDRYDVNDHRDDEAVFEARMEKEVRSYKEQLRKKSEDLRQIRDELDVARSQAANSLKLEKTVRECKKKLEELPALKASNDRLQAELSSRESQQPGSTDHLRGQLERLRKESSVLSAERSEAQNQVQLLRAELEKSKLETQNLATERNKLRRDLTSLREQLPRLSSASCVAPDSEEVVSVSIPRACLGDAERLEDANGADERAEASSEEVPRLHAKNKELLERLLAETGKTSRAEAEVARLTGQQAGSEACVPEDANRELRITQWRLRMEREALVAQETLMASCFHDLGLRYHKLQLERDNLKRELGNLRNESEKVCAHSLQEFRG